MSKGKNNTGVDKIFWKQLFFLIQLSSDFAHNNSVTPASNLDTSKHIFLYALYFQKCNGFAIVNLNKSFLI